MSGRAGSGLPVAPKKSKDLVLPLELATGCPGEYGCVRPALVSGGINAASEDTIVIKVFSLLRRRDDWSREEFQRWWLEEHVPYAKTLPGLRKYKVCLTVASTTHPDDPPFDGVAELWFDSREALEHAWFESEEGKAAVAHSQANVSQRWTLLTEEHDII